MLFNFIPFWFILLWFPESETVAKPLGSLIAWMSFWVWKLYIINVTCPFILPSNVKQSLNNPSALSLSCPTWSWPSSTSHWSPCVPLPVEIEVGLAPACHTLYPDQRKSAWPTCLHSSLISLSGERLGCLLTESFFEWLKTWCWAIESPVRMAVSHRGRVMLKGATSELARGLVVLLS